MVPPAVSGAVNVPWPLLGSGTAITDRVPKELLVASPETAGNCSRMLDGTVKLPAEAAAMQVKTVAEKTALVPDPLRVDMAAPAIVTSPVPPPVQVTLRGEARGMGLARLF